MTLIVAPTCDALITGVARAVLPDHWHNTARVTLVYVDGSTETARIRIRALCPMLNEWTPDRPVPSGAMMALTSAVQRHRGVRS